MRLLVLQAVKPSQNRKQQSPPPAGLAFDL